MAERRSEEQIRSEMAEARKQLADALTDLRESAGGARRRAGVAGGALSGGIALATVLGVVRRLHRRGSSR